MSARWQTNHGSRVSQEWIGKRVCWKLITQHVIIFVLAEVFRINSNLEFEI
jgi:hypothetical protein